MGTMIFSPKGTEVPSELAPSGVTPVNGHLPLLLGAPARGDQSGRNAKAARGNRLTDTPLPETSLSQRLVQGLKQLRTYPPLSASVCANLERTTCHQVQRALIQHLNAPC